MDSGALKGTDDRRETRVLYNEGVGPPLYVGTLTFGLRRHFSAGPEGEALP